MKCVVGLGNPGRKYAATRHNIGYMVLERLARGFGAEFSEYGFSDIAEVEIETEEGSLPVILVRPATYMNESGKALREVLDNFHVAPEDILVIHDDMDLPFGKIRVKRKGSSGGHRGVQSIISWIGTDEFPRLKVGIGRPASGYDAVEHVLMSFTEDEKLHMEEILDTSKSCAIDFLEHGVEATMSRYNGLFPIEENEEN